MLARVASPLSGSKESPGEVVSVPTSLREGREKKRWEPIPA